MFENENIITFIKTVCQQLHVEKQISQFSAQYLVNIYALIDPEDIDCVCNAFTFLSNQGYFTIQSDVYDHDGNHIWEGEPKDMPTIKKLNGEEIRFEDCWVQVSFVATSKFKEEAHEAFQQNQENSQKGSEEE